jgi:putative ABC transport system substrate-binding protein
VTALANVVVAPYVAFAQPATTVHRIGILSSGTPPPGLLEQLTDGLRESGYIEGRNLVIESRSAEGRNERLDALADDLVRRKVDVIVTINTPAALAAKRATTTIPIVITRIGDPVKSGLVRSLAEPGANVTGLSFTAVDVAPKQLQLLREILPTLTLVGFAWYADNPAATAGVDALETAANQMHVASVRLPLRASKAIAETLQSAAKKRIQALVVFEDVWLTNQRAEIVNAASRHSLPVVSLYKDFPEVGGLFAYGASPEVIYRRTAYYVDRVLKGSKPADLPIEQSTKFDLIVNLKAAKVLGLTIPPTLLIRADRVIEWSNMEPCAWCHKDAPMPTYLHGVPYTSTNAPSRSSTAMRVMNDNCPM